LRSNKMKIQKPDAQSFLVSGDLVES